MIIDMLNLAGTLFLEILVSIFQAINFVLPTEFQTYFTKFFQAAKSLDSIFPVSTLCAAMVIYINALFLKYTIQLAINIFAATPFIGKKFSLPKNNRR